MSLTKLSLIALVIMCAILQAEGDVCVGISYRELCVGIRVRRTRKRSLEGKFKITMQLDPCKFAAYDLVNPDGKLTKNELEELFEKMGIAKTDPVNKKMDFYAHKVFQALNENGDEKITPDEFKEKAPSVIIGC